ncbi:PilT domain-containing protein [methanotrophic bacterial endosymbiont of Bathymodiolus sp.]|nr:PilT domain-containing protein [methanotrophic bacterial endosymbiont of Bathymodiolus sp.]
MINNRHAKIEQHFRNLSPSEIALCSIVKAGLLFGARHSHRVEANLQLLQHFFTPLNSLPFDNRCAEEYGLIRAYLSSQGKIIGPNDFLIATIARAYDAILVTHNTKEFSRIIGLRLEDWQS